VLVWMRPAVELTKAEVSLHGSNYAALALPRRVDASVLLYVGDVQVNVILLSLYHTARGVN